MSKIMAVNAGSSSIKFQLLEMPAEKVIASGVMEKIGTKIDGKNVYTQWSTKSWRTVKEVPLPEEPDVPAVPDDPDAWDDPDEQGGGNGSGNGSGNEAIRIGVQNTEIEASSSLTSAGKIRLDWNKSPGYDVDYYEVFRSTARYSGFGTKPYYTTASGAKTWYVNTKGLETGKTYYYKIRGVRVIDGTKVYTQWSTKTWRTIKE